MSNDAKSGLFPLTPENEMDAIMSEEMIRRYNLHDVMLGALKGILPYVGSPDGGEHVLGLAARSRAIKAVLEAINKAEGRDLG
jgi:hypothetical protein